MTTPSRQTGECPPRLGAQSLGDSRSEFLVWAPHARSVEVCLDGPGERLVPLSPAGGSYFTAVIDGAGPGTRYRYRLDAAREYPDPASRCQPEGVHGPSEVVADAFAWTDATWKGHPLLPALHTLDKGRCQVACLDEARALVVRRWTEDSEVLVALAFADREMPAEVPAPAGAWRTVLDSSDRRWGGALADTGEVLISDGALALTLAPGQPRVLVRET